jgi:methyl coenzyme M reductase subunit D
MGVSSQLGKKRHGRRPDMSETTNVSVTLGYTLNLGNFQSLRIDLGITDFVRSGENTDQALDRVYEFVENKVIQKVEEAKKELED